MSERRFYFRELLEGEWTNPQVKSEYLVTESELKHRIAVIIGKDEEIPGLDLGWAIPILLHGDKEQPERTDSLRRAWRDCCDCVHEEEIGTLSCHECFDDPARPIWESKEQPDEWEEWLSRCPTMYLREWFTDMVQILRRKP